MGVLRYSVWIDAQPAAVWRVWTDLDRLPQWQTGSPQVVDASGPGDTVGTTYAVRRGPTRSETTILVADAPTRYVSRTTAVLGLQLVVTTDLGPDRGGTLLALEATTRWPRGLGLIGRGVEAVILNPREAESELANLKALVEREAGSKS